MAWHDRIINASAAVEKEEEKELLYDIPRIYTSPVENDEERG